ncbi:MAG: hypothetical protein EBX41_00850 [Chitinophagia bacterium]|nr:hypothetical protein [Chitinophagia bacterium]
MKMIYIYWLLAVAAVAITAYLVASNIKTKKDLEAQLGQDTGLVRGNNANTRPQPPTAPMDDSHSGNTVVAPVVAVVTPVAPVVTLPTGTTIPIDTGTRTTTPAVAAGGFFMP